MQNKARWFVGLCIFIMLAAFLTACGENDDSPEESTEQGAQSEEGESDESVDTEEPPKEDSGSTGGQAIVATYEGGEVTRSELNAFKGTLQLMWGNYYAQMEMFDPKFETSLLTQLIGTRMIVSQANEEMHQDASERAIAEMAEIRDGFIDTEQQGWQHQLDHLGITEQNIQDYMEDRYIILNYYSEQLSDGELKDLYEAKLEENEHSFTMVSVRHVLVSLDDPYTQEKIRTKEEALERANMIKERLDAGEDFVDLVEEFSDDAGSAANGGLYKNENVNSWVPEFKAATLELKMGEISEPVETQYGYHIMKVESRHQAPFQEVKADLLAELAQQHMTSFMENELKDLIISIDLPEDLEDEEELDNDSTEEKSG